MEVRHHLASCRRVRYQRETHLFAIANFCPPGDLDGGRTRDRRNRLHWGTAQKEGMDGTRAKEESQKGEPIRRPRVDPSRTAVAFDIRFKMDLEGPFTQNEAKKGEDQVHIVEVRENTR